MSRKKDAFGYSFIKTSGWYSFVNRNADTERRTDTDTHTPNESQTPQQTFVVGAGLSWNIVFFQLLCPHIWTRYPRYQPSRVIWYVYNMCCWCSLFYIEFPNPPKKGYGGNALIKGIFTSNTFVFRCLDFQFIFRFLLFFFENPSPQFALPYPSVFFGVIRFWDILFVGTSDTHTQRC